MRGLRLDLEVPMGSTNQSLLPVAELRIMNPLLRFCGMPSLNTRIPGSWDSDWSSGHQHDVHLTANLAKATCCHDYVYRPVTIFTKASAKI